MKGYIRKRGNKWSFTVDVGRDPRTRKRKQKTRSGFKTKKEAQAALAELISSHEKGVYVEPDQRLFKDFALNYLENFYKNDVRASTYDRGRSIVLNHIIPWFGNVQLDEITHDLIHQFYADKLKEGLASSYVRRMHELIKTFLSVAKKWNLIQKDISVMIVPPKIEKKEMKTWSIDQVNDFLKFTKHSRYHPIFFLAAYTGMRKGEILALKWEDIDFEERSIRINKTLYRITNEYLINEPKTKNGIRVIYMDDDVLRVLKKHKVKQNIEKLRAGDCYEDNQLVFAQETGAFVHPAGVNALFIRFIKQSGLPRIRFHDLRHTHATILLGLNTNSKKVSERLGHSSVEITLDTYSHVTQEMRKEVSEQFSKAMKRGQNVVNED